MLGKNFREYVPTELQSHIITSFLFSEDPIFEFNKFLTSVRESQGDLSGQADRVRIFSDQKFRQDV